MTKYEIALRLLAEYVTCPVHGGGYEMDKVPEEWCAEHCFSKGDPEEEIAKCWEKVISYRCEAQGEMDKMELREDVISRQAAIDVIEAGRLTKLIDAETAVNGLKALPPAQPEIVRCKDCVYYNWDCTDAPYGITKMIHWCDLHCDAGNDNLAVNPDDYCAWAERRTDD